MKNHSFTAISLLLLICTTITGCAANKETTSVVATASPSDVKLGFSAWPGWFPWQVAKDRDLFKRNKVTVETKWYDKYNDSIADLESHKIDANSQTLADTISSIAKGNDLVVVLTNDNSTGNDIIAIDGKIKSIRDLKGKKVAAEEGTVDHFLLVQALKRAGMSIKDVKFIPMETAKAAQAFAQGEVDAAAIFAPFTTQALKRPGSRELFSSRDFPGTISDHLVFTRKFVNEHPDKVQAVVDSWFSTMQFIDNSATADDASIIMNKRAGVNTAEYEEYLDGINLFDIDENLSAFKSGKDNTSLLVAASEASTFLFENGLIKKKVDTSKLFDDRFVKDYAARNRKG